MTKVEFDLVTDKVYEAYAQKYHNKGFELKIRKYWNDNTPYTSMQTRISGSKVIIDIYGYHSKNTLSPDGLLIGLCHEIGHTLGGPPYYKKKTDLISSEGQADYFATLKCARLVYLNNENLLDLTKKEKIPVTIQKKCRSHHANNENYAICVSSLLGSLSFLGSMDILNDNFRKGYSLSKVSTVKVSKTILDDYPTKQCRLDTFIAGAICNKNPTKEESLCQRNKKEEGSRPLCWYNPEDVYK